MTYMTLSSQEKHLFYSIHTFTRIRQHYTSQNIGGTNAWAVPTSNFGGTVPPVPLGLRPCRTPTGAEPMALDDDDSRPQP